MKALSDVGSSLDSKVTSRHAGAPPLNQSRDLAVVEEEQAVSEFQYVLTWLKQTCKVANSRGTPRMNEQYTHPRDIR